MSIAGFRAKNHPQQVSVSGARDDVDDRRTRPEIFDPLHAEFLFTLDAAASADNYKVPRFFSREENGLTKSWAGQRVWCNPPYSDIRPWIEKALREVRGNDCRLVCFLLPANRCEQSWWQELIEPFRDRPATGI